MIGNSNKLISTIRSVTKPPLGFRDKVCLVGLCESSEMVMKRCAHVTIKHWKSTQIKINSTLSTSLNYVERNSNESAW